jgi:hypothetical protein
VELSLNLGWLAISVSVFVFFGSQMFAKKTAQNLIIGCIALICLVCLLFPVVSMTDDLNSSLVMSEATKLKPLVSPIQCVHLFSLASVYVLPEHTWSTLVFEQERKPAYQERLSFDLSRRPPPISKSL